MILGNDMRWIFTLAVAGLLSACAYTAQDLARDVDANRTAGRPVFVYALGIENTDTYVKNDTSAGIGFINTGTQAITGVQITFTPYETLHSPVIAMPARTLDLSAALPQGGIPVSMGLMPIWDDGSSLMDCFHMDRVDLTFADGSHASVAGTDLYASMAPDITHVCSSGVRVPDYKAIRLMPVPNPAYMPGRIPGRP